MHSTTLVNQNPLTIAGNSSPRYVKVPIEVLNDKRLNGEAVRAFGVMFDASRNGICTISERKLGERLFKSEQAARRIIRRLQACGWISPIDHGNGKCRDYRLLTPIIHNRGRKRRAEIETFKPRTLTLEERAASEAAFERMKRESA